MICFFHNLKKTDKESQEAKQESELKDVVPFDCDAINSIHLLFIFSVTLNDHEIKVDRCYVIIVDLVESLNIHPNTVAINLHKKSLRLKFFMQLTELFWQRNFCFMNNIILYLSYL